MTKVNLSETRKKAEDAGLLGGGVYLKLKEGANRFRIVSEFLEHPGTYNGKPTFKWLCLVLDRADGVVKPFFMANTVFEQIEALQSNPDYKFDEVPMPFDITLNAKGAGSKDVVYTIIPSPARVALTPDELTAVNAAGSIASIQKSLNDKQAEVAPAAPAEDVVGL